MNLFKKAVAAMLAGTAAVSIAGCSTFDFSNTKNVTQKIDEAVQMPERYRISYEVENPDGEIYTVTKSKDSEGNVYFSSVDSELLFIKDGSLYSLYEKNEDGAFVTSNSKAAFNETYVNNATQEFTQYAEKSKDTFIPGMESSGETEVLGRTCNVYGTKIGTDNTAVEFSFLVDKETGICLGFSEDKKALGQDLETDTGIFTCTEFITDNVPSLKQLIEEKTF